MLPLVQQAIISGFSAIQILKFIGSKFPNLKKGIDAAKASGFDDEKILKFLSQKLPYSKEGAERQLNANDQYLSSIGFKTKQERETARNKALQGALGVGAAALGTYALSRVIPASVSSLMGLKEPQEQNQALKAISSPDQSQNIQTTNDAQQPPNIETAPTIPQQPNIQQDENERRRVEALKRFNEKIKKPGFTEKELDRFLETYAPEEPKIEEPKPEEIKEPKKIEKSSIVASPQGIGEVKEIRNGKALVDIDGTLHKVDENELQTSPVSEKDLAELHDDLIKGIEAETGEEVSRMVQWAGYNPETNTLMFLPHTGKLYKYSNISPERAALLRDILSVRKTSGSNLIGVWLEGSKSPIGAALSKLIKELQAERGGKGKEYEETHETLYSAYEPALEFKKKKKKKK